MKSKVNLPEIHGLPKEILDELQKLYSKVTQEFVKTYIWNASLTRVLAVERRDKEKEEMLKNLYRGMGRGASEDYENRRMPFKLIPNCSDFGVKDTELDWLFALFGISKMRDRTKRSWYGRVNQHKPRVPVIRNWRNGRANRYIWKMFCEMKDYEEKGQYQEYWDHSWKLMNSRAYQIASFNYVHSGWARTLKMSQVHAILSEVKRLVDQRATKIEFRRVYIPKSGGRWRPLGVPSKAWRVYLHMLNNSLVWSRTGKEGSQHAYFPKRGVGSAWQEIMDNHECPDIYEFDIKGFFDNVDLNYLYRRNQAELNMPRAESAWFRKLCRSIVQLTGDDLIREPDRQLRLTANLGTNPNNPQPGKSEEEISRELREEGISLISVTPKGKGWKEKGVPQGASISCSLSTIAISKLTNPKGELKSKIVMYADDGLIFLYEKSEWQRIMKEFERAGVELSEEKSQWIRQAGVWKTEIKFCGLRWNPWTREFIGCSRGGEEIRFGIFEEFLTFILSQRSLLESNEVKLGGSGSHLNSGKGRKTENVSDWFWSCYWEYQKRIRDPMILFSKDNQYRDYFISRMWNKGKGNQGSSNLEITTKECWIRTCWPEYRWRILQEDAGRLWKQEVERLRDRVGMISQEPDYLWYPDKWSVNYYRQFYQTQMRKLTEVKLRLGQLTSYFDFYEVFEDKLDERLNEYELEIRGESEAELSPEGREAKAEEERNTIGDLLKLNLFNASSYGCHDLLKLKSRYSLLGVPINKHGTKVRMHENAVYPWKEEDQAKGEERYKRIQQRGKKALRYYYNVKYGSDL